jgi:heme A synthase
LLPVASPSTRISLTEAAYRPRLQFDRVITISRFRAVPRDTLEADRKNDVSLDGPPRSAAMTGFQRLCLATVVVVFFLIVLGGTVRATDSGLGCPDWPRCHGSFIPKWETHTLIEYSHRLTASVAGFMVLGIVVSAWRSYRRTPGILYPSFAILALVISQATLGGIAVLNELPPEVVAVHLGTALTIIGLLVYVTVAASAQERPLPALRVTPAFARLAAMAGGTTLILMIVGSYVAGADYGLACSRLRCRSTSAIASSPSFSAYSSPPWSTPPGSPAPRRR